MNIIKYCLYCNTPLVLRNSRDIIRKKYCSRQCNANYRVKSYLPLTCSDCGSIFKPRSPNQVKCKSCSSKLQVERSYKYLNNNPEAYIKHLLYRKDRSKLSLEYILDLYNLQNGKCALSGVELTFIKVNDGIKIHTNLSIDRIDSNLGYQIGNIQLVCAIVNIMKSTLSSSEFIWWCKRVTSGG